MTHAPLFPCIFIGGFRKALWLLFAGISAVSAQPMIGWDKTYGGERYEELNALLVLSDGIVAGGSSQSNLTFGNPADFSWNILLAKFDFDGNPLWQRSYGGDQDERLWSMITTSDGGFLAGGYSYSGISGDKTQASRGDMDVWILKLDAQGQLQWDKTFGGLYRDELFAIREKPGGGYLLACNSWSDTGGDKTENSRGLQDFWLISIDPQGNKLWDKTIGGSDYEQINDLEWAPDGTIYLSGGTISNENTGDLGPATARGGMDFLLVKFDPATRQVLWTNRYGGPGEDYPYSLLVSASGKLFMGGRSASVPVPPGPFNNGKDAVFHGGASDFWLIELNLAGQKTRDWSFGGTGLDDLYAMRENAIGQLVLGGVTDSGMSGNKTTAGHGGYDFWLLGLDTNGNKIWEQTLGGSSNDALTQLAVLDNGAYVLGGNSDSNISFEKTDNSFGVNDFWILTTFCDLGPRIQSTGDPLACNPQAVTLDAGVSGCADCLYLWNTGANTPSIDLPAGAQDTFTVLVYNEIGCIAYDTFLIAPAEPPVFNLGPADTILVHGNTLLIGNNNSDWQYAWNTGSTEPNLQVGMPGLYAVTVTDEHGCTASDFIQIQIQKKSFVWVPNIFSPDSDGLNDYLPIYADQSVRRIVNFRIYDRWGDLCFQRDNFMLLQDYDGWDGRFRNKPAPPGVYVWLALVEFLDGTQSLLEGDVTIKR